MAQNDPLPTVTHVYLRKDAQFFADGMWYISTPCPVHGLVDESVTWAEAKTPHHAGLIADARHHECALAEDEKNQIKARESEIQAAVDLRNQQEVNLAAARERVKQAEEAVANPKQALSSKLLVLAAQRLPLEQELRLAAINLEEARRMLGRHEHGMKEAERRVVETRTANT